KRNREGPRLQLGRELKLRELIQVERPAADIGDNNSEKNERSAKKRIERQFHRAVFLVGRTKDRDQEIFWDDDQLVEKEEEEKIGAEEYAIGAADYEQEPKEKLVRAIGDIPGKQNRADRDDSRYQNESQTDAVDREMIIHSQRRNPRDAHDGCEVRKIDIIAKKCRKTDHEPGGGGDKRNPACKDTR